MLRKGGQGRDSEIVYVSFRNVASARYLIKKVE